jgi:hypothetical protein
MRTALPTTPILSASATQADTQAADHWADVAVGPDDPRPGADWASFQAARERFFAQVRPQAILGQDGVNAR